MAKGSDESGAESLGFGYRATRDGKVFISWQGRDVTVLKGAAASRFIDRVSGASERDAQLEMARATGHFKHGNERR